MGQEFCRAITFINYHIPLVLASEMEIQYSTVGFFDGMVTERLELNPEEELKDLWKYGLKRTTECVGEYSYQNVFCLSKDEWNQYEDAVFWNEDSDEKYPLTFVVFLQLKGYRAGVDAIADQCGAFNRVLQDKLKNDCESFGMYYSYCTIDKNDFVVCLKCSEYKGAVEAIKELHNAGRDVVYSYSVFSVSNKVLMDIQSEKYEFLYRQWVESICLKGIANSYESWLGNTLDKKYFDFCDKLVKILYDKKYRNPQIKEEPDYKTYDILGDDDFRLIARHVNLGILLRQFAPGGMLCYKEKDFQFYMFSSNLILNTITPPGDAIEEDYKKKCIQKMEEEFCSPICDCLQAEVKYIKKQFSYEEEPFVNEKLRTVCHAIWQLLRSLKALESAPTKKYDFWSLYKPYSLLVMILEEKLETMYASGSRNKMYELSNTDNIYDFIHKISMTLHGTLRTDIQFFQIKDFNVIIHYAPAKLRAFYALWALRLSDYYNDFSDEKNDYSFIFSPGLFRHTSVKQLFANYDEKKRLMLITVPERHLYEPKRLSLTLAHEVSHFVGKIRNREKRNRVLLEGCIRVLALELYCYRYHASRGKYQKLVAEGIQESLLYMELKELISVEEEVLRIQSGKDPYKFHSQKSFERIEEAFSKASRSGFLEKAISDDCERMNTFLKKEGHLTQLSTAEKTKKADEIRRLTNDLNRQLLAVCTNFQIKLEQLLQILRYITSEAYADLTAILTLDLTPCDYIRSFTEGELFSNAVSAKEQEQLLLYVRAAITMGAVQKIIHRKPKSFTRTGFVEKWSGNVIKDLPLQFPVDSVEMRVAISIYGYSTGMKDCSKKIDRYESLYNYQEGKFVNNILDFLNDRVVRELIGKYMDQCAEDYACTLEKRQSLRIKKEGLAKTYYKISTESAVSLAQEIEDFLSEYESAERAKTKSKFEKSAKARPKTVDK